MMLEDERQLKEKEEFYRRRLKGQLLDAVGLAMESDPSCVDGARKAFEHAKKTAEFIGTEYKDESVNVLVEKTGLFLASILG